MTYIPARTRKREQSSQDWNISLLEVVLCLASTPMPNNNKKYRIWLQKLGLSSHSSKRHSIAEGSRQARVLPSTTKISLDASSDSGRPHKSAGSDAATSSKSGSPESLPLAKDAETVSGDGSSDDQRPTRPLDLDTGRAQVAEDNMDYIRHLGLDAPSLTDQKEQFTDEWLYLNLLFNMAQLHTLNVTPAFVRGAIAEISTCLELSEDGHRLRWKGDQRDSRSIEPTNSATSIVPTSTSSRIDVSRPTRELRHKSNGPLNESGLDHGQLMLLSSIESQNKSNDLSRRRATKITAQSQSLSSHTTQKSSVSSSLALDGALTNTSSFVNSSSNSASVNNAVKTTSNSTSGPLIFYKTTFYSDHTGDATLLKKSKFSEGTHSTALGSSNKVSQFSEIRGERTFSRFRTLPPTSPFDTSAEVLEGLEDVQLSTRSTAIEERAPVELPACGLGGSTPQDNFVLDVQYLRLRKQSRLAPKTTPYERAKARGLCLRLNTSKTQQDRSFSITTTSTVSYPPGLLFQLERLVVRSVENIS